MPDEKKEDQKPPEVPAEPVVPVAPVTPVPEVVEQHEVPDPLAKVMDAIAANHKATEDHFKLLEARLPEKKGETNGVQTQEQTPAPPAEANHPAGSSPVPPASKPKRAKLHLFRTF